MTVNGGPFLWTSLWNSITIFTGSGGDATGAVNKTITSSSQFDGRTGAEKALDGLISSVFRSIAGPDQWWKVDLGEEQFIRRIRIYNLYFRSEYLKGFDRLN